MHRSPLIRIAAAVAALSVVLTIIPVAPASAEMTLQAIPGFTFRGSGFGHGIGMSQYGAQGSALAGMDYRSILAHYYTGTTIGQLAGTSTVKVNIDPAYSSSNGGYTSTTRSIAPGQTGATLSINGVTQPAGTYRFTGSGSNVVVRTPSGSTQTLSGSVRVAPVGGSPALLSVGEGSGIYNLPNCKYRGEFLISASGGKLKLLNIISIDAYCYGVVPRESPSGWQPEALKAQAVAARSYAYASGGELYCTTMSQAYQGYGAYNSKGEWVGEASSTNAAVDATSLQVLKYGGNVIRAYYSSQSGGHTANNEDVWVSGTPLAWARGVPDPYEYLAKPSYSPWPSGQEKTYTGLGLAAKLQGISGVPPASVYVTGISLEKVASGHVKYATFTFANGARVRITGDAVRSKLGLLSTRFYLTGFPMERLSGATRYDTAVKVSQVAFPPPLTAPTVVLASGEDYADALTGSALAGVAKGALLLTASKSLPTATSTELRRLAPTTVYIMGGTTAVASSVENTVRSALPGATITRVQGPDRYQTAHESAKMVASLGGAEKAIVVSGTGWADAAAASALAYAKSYPILLTHKDSLDVHTAEFLATQKPNTTVLVGGASVLSAAVQTAIQGATGGRVERDGGSDRYQTAALVAERCIRDEGFLAEELYIATGASYVDALTGGTLAGAKAQPLLLTHTNSCPVNTAYFLRAHRSTVKKLWLLGGEVAISSVGLTALDMEMMR